MLQSEGGSRDVTKSSFKTVPDPTEGETTADKIDLSDLDSAPIARI